jgi:hypothetical protein
MEDLAARIDALEAALADLRSAPTWDGSGRWYPAGYDAASDITNAGRALRIRSVGDPGDLQFIRSGADNSPDTPPISGTPRRGESIGRIQWMIGQEGDPATWNNGNGADGALVEQYGRVLDRNSAAWYVDVSIPGAPPHEPVAGIAVSAEDGVLRLYLVRRDGSRRVIASETDGGWSPSQSYGYPAGWQQAGPAQAAANNGRLHFASPPGAPFEAWVDDRGVPYQQVATRPPESEWRNGPLAAAFVQPLAYP